MSRQAPVRVVLKEAWLHYCQYIIRGRQEVEDGAEEFCPFPMVQQSTKRPSRENYLTVRCVVSDLNVSVHRQTTDLPLIV